jgi:hypothetical protein
LAIAILLSEEQRAAERLFDSHADLYFSGEQLSRKGSKKIGSKF